MIAVRLRRHPGSWNSSPENCRSSSNWIWSSSCLHGSLAPRSRISALPAASMDAASMSASRVVLELPRPSRLPSSFPDRTSTPYVCVPPRRRQDLTVHEVCWCTEVTRIIPTLERGGIVRIKTKVGFVWRFHPYSLSEIGSTGQVRAVVNRIERERAPTYA